MRATRFNTTRFAALASLIVAGAALADGRRGPDDSSDSNNSSDTGSDTSNAGEHSGPLFFSALTGQHEPDVDLPEGLIDREDVIMVYQHQFGIYPMMTMGGEISNGGLPQNVDIREHLLELERDINIQIPQGYSGYVIIDYEEWHPFWEDTAMRYRLLAIDQVRAEKPDWDEAKVQRKARKNFEKAAKKYFKRTLDKCRQLRPDAKFGIWSYPRAKFRDNNAKWLWSRHDAYFPGIYMASQYVPDDIEPGLGQENQSQYVEDMLVGRVSYARELAGTDKRVMPVIWPRYSGNNPNEWLRYRPLTSENLTLCMEEPFDYGADGIVIWDNIAQPQIAESFQEQIDYEIAPEIRRILTEMGLPTDGLENEIDPGDDDEPIDGVDSVHEDDPDVEAPRG